MAIAEIAFVATSFSAVRLIQPAFARRKTVGNEMFWLIVIGSTRPCDLRSSGMRTMPCRIPAATDRRAENS